MRCAECDKPGVVGQVGEKRRACVSQGLVELGGPFVALTSGEQGLDERQLDRDDCGQGC